MLLLLRTKYCSKSILPYFIFINNSLSRILLFPHFTLKQLRFRKVKSLAYVTDLAQEDLGLKKPEALLDHLVSHYYISHKLFSVLMNNS